MIDVDVIAFYSTDMYDMNALLRCRKTVERVQPLPLL